MSSPIPVVICDDSSIARLLMAKALSHWNVDITFAEHGLSALEQIRAGLGDVMFLDLNMPILDGYQVLERIRSEDLPTMVIVVSGDIQPEARERVLQLGALDFIQKPFTEETVATVLRRFGLLSELSEAADQRLNEREMVALPDYYQEVANVAMGRAGERLARFLNTFVNLPVPQVRIVSRQGLERKFRRAAEQSQRIVSQGFIGAGLAGETLLSMEPDGFPLLARLLKLEYRQQPEIENDMLLELSNIVSGAFLQAFARQIDLQFSYSAPVVLPPIRQWPDQAEPWDKTLAITIEYGLLERQVGFELMLVFSEDSLDKLKTLSEYL